MPFLNLGADMARLSKTGGKKSKAKGPKASPARDAKAAETKHRVGQAKTSSNGRSIADLEAALERQARELDEARRQQAATAEILKVINASPGDLTPVFDIILEKAHSLCAVASGSLQLYAGGQVRTVAMRGFNERWENIVRQGYQIDDGNREFLESLTPRHDPDVREALKRSPDNRVLRAFVEIGGFRTFLALPLLTEGKAIGRIVAARTTVHPFTETQIALLQGFADQAVIAIQNAGLLRQKNEGLEQQAASAEILRTIASAPGDAEQSLQQIAETTARLFSAQSVTIRIAEGSEWVQTIRVGAGSKRIGSLPAAQTGAQAPNVPGTVFRENRQIHIPDLDNVDPAMADWPMMAARAEGTRTISGTPLRREGNAIGALVIYRDRLAPFTTEELALQQTFADQAVIAIENARLFNETKEALEQQTATADVLKVISASPGQLEPVFSSMLENAIRICDAKFGNLFLVDGDSCRWEAGVSTPPKLADYFTQSRSFRPTRGSHLDRVLRTKQASHTADDAAESVVGAAARLGGARSTVCVPMIKDAALVGAIFIYRTEVRPFTEKQIDLLKNFAAQAVIAVENTRLLKELRQRTNDLSESLEQQTATSEVLQAISSSAGELDPVFEKMLENATRICGANFGTMNLYEDGGFRTVALYNAPEAYASRQLRSRIQPHPHSGLGTIERTHQIIQIEDIRAEPPYREGNANVVALADLAGARTLVLVPMLKEQELIGAITIFRQEVRPFTEKQTELVANFAKQAVIAIENTRLLKELRERTDALTLSLDELRTAQDRLVQTEKLASLGQLTAGIAHEIKNPLNFVNNFSALSAELVDEVNDLLKGTVLDRKPREELDELTSMLKSNLEKVVQHGKRADSIVKNMLLHSREGSGEQRSADINTLVEESLNLAYHGARAEKSAFNITLKRDLDPEAGTAELYPQEITRALLNLISNGFYAATRRKSGAEDDTCEPMLSATTKNLGNKVEICIRDNGTGIPPEVKEKMFNPFFTTKPAGEGTGLGLSMTHDIIVKQHGGSIDVESVPGVFTEFTIVLPRTSSQKNKQRSEA